MREYTAVPVDEPTPIDTVVIPEKKPDGTLEIASNIGKINARQFLRLLQQKVPRSEIKTRNAETQTSNADNADHEIIFSAQDLVEKLQIALLKKAAAHHLELFTFTKRYIHNNTNLFLLSQYSRGLADAARVSETLQRRRNNRFPLGIAQLRASTFKENTIVAYAKWMALFLLTMGAAVACFDTSLFDRLSDPIDEKLIHLANATKYNETQNVTHPPINFAKVRMRADLLVDVIYGMAVILTCCLSAFLLSRIDMSRRFPSDELKKIMQELNERYKQESSLRHLNNPIIDRIAELLLASKDARQILNEVINESLEIIKIKNKPQAPAPGSR